MKALSSKIFSSFLTHPFFLPPHYTKSPKTSFLWQKNERNQNFGFFHTFLFYILCNFYTDIFNEENEFDTHKKHCTINLQTKVNITKIDLLVFGKYHFTRRSVFCRMCRWLYFATVFNNQSTQFCFLLPKKIYYPKFLLLQKF